MKTAHIIFDDPKYNYSTSVNGRDAEIKDYFIGTWFNLGSVKDNMQKCIGCDIDPSENTNN